MRKGRKKTTEQDRSFEMVLERTYLLCKAAIILQSILTKKEEHHAIR